MCQSSKEGVNCLPHQGNLISGYRNWSIWIFNLLHTHLYLARKKRSVMNNNGSLINSPQGNQAGKICFDVQAIPIWVTRLRIVSWGINTTLLCAYSRTWGTNQRLRRQCKSLRTKLFQRTKLQSQFHLNSLQSKSLLNLSYFFLNTSSSE